MLKQLFVPVLGLTVMTAATPAAADKGRAYWVQPAPKYIYKYDARRAARAVPAQPRYKRKFERNLDFETEAVWRNLRPNLFD